EDDRGVQLARRPLVGSAGPGRPELAREGLRLLVAGARERVHAAPLVDGQLADHVCRRAEAVEADARGGDARRRVAAVAVKAREARPRAEVLPPRQAVAALAVRPREPGHADAGA